MIHTIFCSAASQAERPWQTELLGYSWGRARQPGELVHLAARGAETARCHPQARIMETRSWSPHPYTGDVYPPYQKAAALMEWLFVDGNEGTVLLLEPTSVFRAPLSNEVRPGQARAAPWRDLPRGDGPFGLGPGFEFLSAFCVDRALELPAVRLPLLIHSSELRKLAPRWLELMSIIRAETAGQPHGPRPDADELAYVIAAAEAGIPHAIADLGASTGRAEALEAPPSGAPILDYRRSIRALDGTVAWDAGSYRDGTPVQPEAVTPGLEREFLRLFADLLERRAQGLELSQLRPHRQQGVREGKILGSMFLEIPGREDTVSLNSSGAAIWEICDGTRSLAEINRELETRFEMPPGSLRPDVEVVIKRLEGIGALRLESA
ncbi:MAG TPA: PqqD family protein [Polyangia bacterium]|jgi:hypothetical protein